MQLLASAPDLNNLLSELAPVRRQPRRFLYSTIFVCLAILTAAFFEALFGASTATVFAFFVVVSTALLGIFAGLCTVVLGALAVDFFYLPPVFHLNLDTGTLRIAIGLTAIAFITHTAERRISRFIRERKRPAIGIEGHFDGIEDGEAYGWAWNADAPHESILVTAFVDGKAATQVAAVHHRPDIAEKKNAGSHGFYIDLRPHVGSDAEVSVDVRLSNGRPLPGGMRKVRMASTMKRRPLPTVLFMHIPKTAGTALREAIAANYLQSEIAYLYPTAPGLLITDLRMLPFEQLRRLQIVIGHFQFGMHEWLPQQFEYVTVVRDPVSRVLSRYRYLDHTGHRDSSLSLAALLTSQLRIDFDNAMVRHFAGVDERLYGPGQLTEEHFDRAVLNLRNGFIHVGHQESLDETYAFLADRYDWKPLDQLPAVNVTHRVDSNQPTATAIAAIRHFNRWDCLLYEEVCRQFPRRQLDLTAGT